MPVRYLTAWGLKNVSKFWLFIPVMLDSRVSILIVGENFIFAKLREVLVFLCWRVHLKILGAN